MKLQNIFIVSFFILLTICMYGQNKYSIKNKKAIKLFEQSYNYYQQSDYLNAVNYLQKALDIDSNFVEAYNLLAQIFEDRRDPEKAIYYYKLAIKHNPDYSYITYYILAGWQYRLGDYYEARDNYNKCLDFEGVSPKYIELCNLALTRLNKSIEIFENPVDFKPENMGTNVNTKYDDYWPSLSLDGKTLMTTVRLPIDARFPLSHKNSQEDFYISYMNDGVWSKTKNIGPPINTPDNEGAQSLSPDGRYLFYTVCNRKQDYGSCDIYMSVYSGDQWSEPKNIGPPVSTSAWESSPSFSSDGRTLYFVRDGKGGGYGGSDIWMSTLGEDGVWSEPENLGDTINTRGNEVSPFIHPDGKTLYFSSNGHPGLGGEDIFVSHMDSLGKWTIPINLGYPINTYKDEFGLIVNSRGDIAMYSAEKEDSRMKDIYEFSLPQEMRPDMVLYVKGKVYDADTNKPLGAIFELIDLDDGRVAVRSYSDPANGKYIAALPVNNDYAFNVEHPDYLFYSESFSLKENTSAEPVEMNIPLQPIKPGATVELKNIFFETDKYDLKTKSYIELDKLVIFLKNNPNVKVEIGGHTDNVGSLQHNQILSENRAKVVYEYLLSNNIEKSRLSYKGYNYSVPKYPNDTPENRAKNRRTEFKIISL